MTGKPEPACSVLIKLLGDDDLDVRLDAMISLANMGDDAAPAVPVLAGMWEEVRSDAASRRFLPYYWAYALKGIGLPAAAAVPQLIELAKDSGQSDSARERAVAALATIGPADGRTVPVLLELSGTEGCVCQRAAIVALGSCR